MVIKMYRDKKSTQRKLSVFSHVSEKDSVSSYVERDLSYNPM